MICIFVQKAAVLPEDRDGEHPRPAQRQLRVLAIEFLIGTNIALT